jgi:hypothetical protein
VVGAHHRAHGVALRVHDAHEGQDVPAHAVGLGQQRLRRARDQAVLE